MSDGTLGSVRRLYADEPEPEQPGAASVLPNGWLLADGVPAVIPDPPKTPEKAGKKADWRQLWTSAAELGGIASISVGFGWFSPGLGFIAAGAGMIVLGVAAGRV